MPHIARISNNLHIEGAHTDIIVYPSKSVFDGHALKGTPCPFIKISFCLIDTGATNSCIDLDIAKQLNLIARDKRMVGNANGEAEQFMYDVGFKLPLPTIQILPLQVFGADLSKQPYKALIGRDLLKSCILVYNGITNSWSLSI